MADTAQPNSQPDQPNSAFNGITFQCNTLRTDWHSPESLKFPKPFQDVFDQNSKDYETQKDPKSGKETKVFKSEYAIAAVDGFYVKFVSGLKSKEPILIKSPDKEFIVKFIKAEGQNEEIPPNTFYFVKLTGLGPNIKGPRFIPLASNPPSDALVIDLKA